MICIIPARGGSKRIPGKNIKPFLGKPIIEYPIKIAKFCGYDVVVSTDDREIAKVAVRAGARVLDRPPYLSLDQIEVEDVIYSIVKDKKGVCCMMYPTSVFVHPRDLVCGNMLGADLVYSITKFSYPIQRALEITDGEVKMINQEYRNSQDIPVRYHDAAQFYMFDVMAFCDAWSRGKRLLELRAYGIEYATNEVQDIDTPEDWAIAEMKYKARGI